MRNFAGGWEGHYREASRIFIENLLGLEKGRRLLIYVDQGSDRCTTNLIQHAAEEFGAWPEVHELRSDQSVSDMLNNLTFKIEQGDFDVICELSGHSLYPTKVWKRARQLGCRIYALGALTVDSFVRCVGQVNHELMFRFGLVLRDTLEAAQSAKIISKRGTNIEFEMRPSHGVGGWLYKMRTRRKFWVGFPSGMITDERKSTFMGGQVAFQGVPETMNGTVVIDGYLWPPREIGRVEVPIVLKIRKGSIVEIAGCLSKGRHLSRWLDGRDNRIKHFCIGFNPGAELTGEIAEAERVFGCISVGIGSYPHHTDGVMRRPSMLLDGRVIEQDGSFVDEELAVLERDLIQHYHDSRRKSQDMQ